MSSNEDDRDVDLARPRYREQSASYMEIVDGKIYMNVLKPDHEPRALGNVIEDGDDKEESLNLESLKITTANRQNSNSTIRQSDTVSVYEREDTSNYEDLQNRRTSQVSEHSFHDAPEHESTVQGEARLQKLLVEIFDLEPDEQLIEKCPGWLLKSILLQGQLFITSNYLCFHSYFPVHKDVIIRSGYLIKKSRTSARQHRHWFVLQNTTLSYYDDASDIYYAAGNIDLSKAVDAVADIEHSSSGQFAFRLVAQDREYFLRADTASSANEWIKILKKVIFQSRNQGDAVLVRIPLHQVVDVEPCDILKFAPSIKITVSQEDDSYVIQEYYFTLLVAADTILDVLRKQVQQATKNSAQAILDTSKAAKSYEHPKFLECLAKADQVPNIEVFAEGLVNEQGTDTFDRLHIGNPFSFLNGDSDAVQSSSSARSAESTRRTSSPHRSIVKTVGSTIRGVANVATSVIPTQIFISKAEKHAEQAADDEANTIAFKQEFALPENTKLLKAFDAYHQHTVPLPGTLYIGSSHVAFRSSATGTKVRLLIPMEDVESANREKGLRFPFSGLTLSVRAHEALQFEFVHTSDRDQCITFINGCLDNSGSKQQRKQVEDDELENKAKHDKQIHEQLDKAAREAGMRIEKRRPPLENVLDAPPVVFDSPNASMVAFKPVNQMRFTCLTIGSRGDVQPYVALCKGLIADGQKAKIATHEEFRDFVEGHGIEFVPIDGNPEELMAICVEHGMFTYSFLKEASQKFRGWIDELLKSAWKACQNTDVLIESPSAMAGIHIAEALGIPYYRAFTMPWSKTRIYPHAFAVPDSSKGGTYNMLTYSAFDLLFWKAISGQVNRWRKKALNLPATNFDKLAQHKVPFLYNFSPYVVPPALDWPDWIRVTGYWFLDNPDDKKDSQWKAPKKVVDFIKRAKDDHKKLIYIGFGSIVVSDPAALTKAVVEAVNKSGTRCILVKGWSDRSSKSEDKKDKSEDDAEPDYGDNILPLDSIPHDWLFPQMNVVVHHGGAGSLGASLRAGIPTIVKPFFGDQHFFGDRVQNLGVGMCLKKLTVKRLREAIETCCTDKLIIQKAQKIGEKIRNERGVDYAIENIYRDMEYAKSLIKDPKRAAQSEHSDDSWVIEDAPDASDADDEDLFDTKTDEHGHVVSILKSIKDLRLPNPLGNHSGHYNLSGISLFKHKAEVFKLKALHVS